MFQLRALHISDKIICTHKFTDGLFEGEWKLEVLGSTLYLNLYCLLYTLTCTNSYIVGRKSSFIISMLPFIFLILSIKPLIVQQFSLKLQILINSHY